MKNRSLIILLTVILGTCGAAFAQEGIYLIGGYQTLRMQPNTAINRIIYSFNQQATQPMDLLQNMQGIVIGYGSMGDGGGVDLIWDRKKADLGTYEDASRGWAESARIHNNSFRLMPYIHLIPAEGAKVSLGASLDVTTFKTKRYQSTTGRWVLEPGGFLGGFNPTINSSIFMHFTFSKGPVGLRITPHVQLPWYYDHFGGLFFVEEFFGPIEGTLASDQLQYLANYGIQAQLLIFLENN